MKKLLIIFFIQSFSLSAIAKLAEIKFTATTDGPGISVEGEVKKPNIDVSFNEIEKGKVSMNIKDLTTGMERRDKHLYEKVFNITSDSLEKIELQIKKINCLQKELFGNCKVDGLLKIKNIEKPILFESKIDSQKKLVEGKAFVSLKEFNLNAPSFMGIQVMNDVEVTFKVEAN